ncbi:hypothetical protein BDW22DRAFT_1432941 [Trametopsis cervina]|nr:hypothetical protein BDW22DRAFT_1432941 [Trametopsis cervina]
MVGQTQWRMHSPANDAVDTIASSYLSHPDGRVVAAFFLGSVFMHALQYLFSSNWIQDALCKFRTAIRACYMPVRSKGIRVDLENPATLTMSEKGGFLRKKPEDELESPQVRLHNDHASLIFVLNLCLLFGAFTSFLTLLAFGNGWDTGCTFLVAWAGMSSQMARLLGMLILIIELTVVLDLRNWTVWALRGMLVVALVFIFVANATNTGAISAVGGTHSSVCFKQHFLATSLVSSIIRILMELYLSVRVVILLWSTRRLFDDSICASRPLSRSLSLLVFDVITLVPDAIQTNIFAQFIPFAVGAILVLATFNWTARKARKYPTSRVQSLLFFNKPPVGGDPLLVPTPFTLHFPREHRNSTSWRSTAGLPATSSVEDIVDVPISSRPMSMYTAASSRPTSQQNVENAIITRASPAVRRPARQVSFSRHLTSHLPASAPAQLSGFASTYIPSSTPTLPRKILPSQVEYAEELEREQERLEQEILELSQPAVPPLNNLPRGRIIVQDDEDDEYERPVYTYGPDDRPIITPSSAFFNADVTRNASRRTRRITRSTAQLSPAPTQASFMPSPYDSRRSTYDSYDSHVTRSSDHSSEENSQVSAKSRTKTHSFLSPTDTPASKSPWRHFNRYSFASIRSKSREELPTVQENSPTSSQYPVPTVTIGKVPSGSKRRTFGQSVTPKRANRPSLHTVFNRQSSPIPPVPMLPTPRGVSPLRPFDSPQASSSVLPAPPSVQVFPATPEPVYIPEPTPALPSSPAWISRPIRSSIVRGPRPPPSAPILPSGLGRGSGWPRPLLSSGYVGTGALGPLSRRPTNRSRSSSLPSLYSRE